MHMGVYQAVVHDLKYHAWGHAASSMELHESMQLCWPLHQHAVSLLHLMLLYELRVLAQYIEIPYLA